MFSTILLTFVIIGILGLLNKPSSTYKNNPQQRNPMEGKKVVFVEDENDEENADGVKGHLELNGESEYKRSFYERYIKRLFDIIVSFMGITLLLPVLIIISIIIFIDDPGPVMFTQKRVGINKRYFKLHKFRSMKMSTPHDIPTHMLDNPEQYITKIGSFIRKTSLDELPQLWDIFIGNMSIIGPRPALWNQDLLVAERDKYNANSVVPGLTGWAQINGRDAIEIPVKAKLDGEYTRILNKGNFSTFVFECKVFLGTILSVITKDGIVEGRHGQEFHNPINPNDGKTIYEEDEYQNK